MCNENHDDFPSLLAEVLDVLAELEYRPKAMADRLHELYCKPKKERTHTEKETTCSIPSSSSICLSTPTPDPTSTPPQAETPGPSKLGTESDADISPDGHADRSFNSNTNTPSEIHVDGPTVPAPLPSRDALRCHPGHVSATQIIDFLKRNPVVIRAVNSQRQALGLHRLMY